MVSWLAVMLLATGGAVGVAQSAQAAVPNGFGFALYFGGVVSQQWPVGTSVTPSGGHYTVMFPGVGVPGGVVHVTAVQDGLAMPPGRWCQADDWTSFLSNEFIGVSCYRPGGLLDPTVGFSVMFSASSGPASPGLYGYVDSSPTGAIISQYNSASGLVSVVPSPPGVYTVNFFGMGTLGPKDGGLEVTAVNPTAGARCKVANWTSSASVQSALIFCFDGSGALTNNRFTVSYQFKRSLYGGLTPPTRFGYLWNMPTLGPPSTNYNSMFPPGNMLSGTSPWMVNYPLIGATPGNVQVTAFGSSSDYCSLRTPWFGVSPLVSSIACFNNVGGLSGSGFLTSYSSRF
jgi:hypothetical protein